MKKSLILITAAILTLVGKSIAQNPTYDWTKTLETSGVNGGRDILIDNNNNLYFLGNYSGTVDLDFGTGSDLHTAVGSSDLCIVKTDMFGNFIWGKSYGGFSTDFVVEMDLDEFGALYMVGQYSDSISFNVSGSVLQYSSNGPGSDVFVLKLDTLGNIEWSKAFGSSGSNTVGGLSVDSLGNVCIAGNFHGTIDLDPGPSQSNYTSNGGNDFYTLCLDTDGNFLWAHTFGGINSDRALCITRDLNDNIYVGGIFGDTVDFDPSPSVSIVNALGDWDMFILKLTSDGNFVWVKTIGGDNASGRLEDITCDPWGNVISTGRFSQSMDFDPGVNTDVHEAISMSDVFVQKLSSNGNFLWARTFGGSSNEVGWGVSTDVTGSVYTTGQFRESVDFDPGLGTDIHEAMPSLGSNSDVFIHKLDSSGNFQWVRTFGDEYDDEGYSVVTLGSSIVYVTGSFCGNVDFNPDGNSDIQYSNGSELFIQKLNQCNSTSSNSNIIACEEYISPSGNYLWTTSGIYNDTVLNSMYCDSILTVDLTINEISSLIDEHYTCDSLQWMDGNTYTTSTSTPTWILTNDLGCDSIITLNLVVTNVNNSVIQLGDTTLQANSTIGEYQWLYCDTSYNIINGAIDQSYIIQQNGSYAVQIIENGCTDTSECITISNLGILENNFGYDLTAFPNPTKKTITVSLGSSFSSIEIQILDINGKTISSNFFNDTNEFNIDINGNPGQYTLCIYSGEKQARIKVIKQ